MIRLRSKPTLDWNRQEMMTKKCFCTERKRRLPLARFDNGKIVLRKLLTPKNALMALYELIGNKNCDFKINADAKGFLAEVLVNNVRYEGRGMFKTH